MPELHVPRCQNCGELLLDGAANRQISDALRQQLGLLSPEQVRHHREALGFTQRQLAAQLGIAEATLSRWETGGQIQQRALDRFLRVYFAFENVRAALADEARLAMLGTPLAFATAAEEKSPSWGEEGEQASPLARVARSLDSLPRTKPESAVEELQRLMELMK